MKLPHFNIFPLYLLVFFETFSLFTAFEKIYLQQNGLSISEIVWLSIFLGITILICEVPSGALSDRWYRKYTLSLSFFFGALSLLVFLLGTGFWHYSVAVLFGGWAFVCNSGTNSSLLYDSLKEAGLENKFAKYLATRRIISAVSFGIAALVGGYVAQQYGIDITILFGIGLLTLGLIITFILKEPDFHRTTGEMSYFSHIGTTARYLMSTKFFINVALLSIVTMSVHIIIEDYSQLYYYAIGLTLLLVGVMSAFEGVKEVIFNYWGGRTTWNSNTPRLFGIFLFVMFFSLLLTAWQGSYWGIVGLFIASGMFFVIDVPIMARFHDKADSGIRATSESFLNLVTEMFRISLALAFGYIAQAYSIQIGFGLLAGVVGTYTVYYWMFAKKHIQ